jgi:hypothetical protein
MGSTVRPVWSPPSWAEYTFYFTVFYSLISSYLGIEIPLVAAGITVALAGFCWKEMGPLAKQILAPIKLLLACIVSYIVVLIAFHGTSPMDENVRTFILWFCSMIVVQSLLLRQGFLLRCTVFLFLIALITVPNLRFGRDVVDRASVAIPLAGNLTNANGLAGWFGFCVVVFAINGFETKRTMVRMSYWALATGSLLIVGLTVSRGALLGVAFALVIGFRRLLKSGFIPVLICLIFVGTLVATGLFDKAVSNYEERGTEETGRGKIWPAVLGRISESPLVGVDVSDIFTFIDGRPTAPHNSFLFVGLTSGVFPLGLWIAFWIQAARSSVRLERSIYAAYRIPLLIYALSAFIFGDITTAPWALLSLSVGAGPVQSYQIANGSVLRRVRGRRPAPPLVTSVKGSH